MEVDLPGLVTVGGAVTAASDGFRTAYTASESDLPPAAGSDGWATDAALRQAAAAWQVFTGNLAGQVRTFGDGLTASARALQGSDQAAADRLGGVRQPPR
ncbi:hypothetical protein BJ973_004889 [Actinoplanes tereljensis]|uniref:Excreted virulence factor EspC (Type VII ESX diderm) n=1 Tax=Paractinoplanes tereljensis TaxID=571912 RepID=A0A919TV64_9ACTN|nr:hypothetical protein [Actinoplanes tereljensis]GIF21667.1 hypothetical protein Ate02nite_43970 [Actinoplanes tereljensis]